ncbi:phosphogluconate dehydrogenase (NAD(+)-dependent, decarboxylating) [Desulfovibrio inopinatus]|uniref:phosphogluconate dehydrogenase (NAD(+)-dependent, decarboxylating) n=1 Tax=Desulfovibrio inopinatus TaxID=102109 RepID=UPI000417E0A8|nr:decarboxylating 6-phosphogluconate dehydrogenase [Desulfovibrio inopinatus]
MKLAMLGLGRMGGNMAKRLSRAGHQVVAWNRTFSKAQDIAKTEEHIQAVETFPEVVAALEAPRVVWVMLPAGKPVDDALNQLIDLLEPGDIVVEGGNTHFKDDLRRAPAFTDKGIHYVDAGVSGGIWGLQIGYCTMLGGPKEAVQAIEPAMIDLAPRDGFLHCGPTGAGHFVKMVHNGIEYGMMQAYAEGFAVLDASEYSEHFDYTKISHLWNQGSVIRSWLLELCERMFSDDPHLDGLEAYVDDSGEGRWTVSEAIDTAVPTPVLTLALMERFRSRQPDFFGDRVLAALRNQFGGHAVKKK